jgi:hypothetical protein
MSYLEYKYEEFAKFEKLISEKKIQLPPDQLQILVNTIGNFKARMGLKDTPLDAKLVRI